MAAAQLGPLGATASSCLLRGLFWSGADDRLSARGWRDKPR
jgi:hypothetical protein